MEAIGNIKITVTTEKLRLLIGQTIERESERYEKRFAELNEIIKDPAVAADIIQSLAADRMGGSYQFQAALNTVTLAKSEFQELRSDQKKQIQALANTVNSLKERIKELTTYKEALLHITDTELETDLATFSDIFED